MWWALTSSLFARSQELLPQDDPAAYLHEPAPHFRSYYYDAGGADAKFVQFGIPDMSPAPSLKALGRLVDELKARVIRGEVLYVHCWGGAGRTGLVAACLLGALYPSIAVEEALERVQAYFTARGEPGYSPETDAQVQQVREWYDSDWRAPTATEAKLRAQRKRRRADASEL